METLKRTYRLEQGNRGTGEQGNLLSNRQRLNQIPHPGTTIQKTSKRSGASTRAANRRRTHTPRSRQRRNAHRWNRSCRARNATETTRTASSSSRNCPPHGYALTAGRTTHCRPGNLTDSKQPNPPPQPLYGRRVMRNSTVKPRKEEHDSRADRCPNSRTVRPQGDPTHPENVGRRSQDHRPWGLL